MAVERSPYEGVLDDRLSGNTCLGKIVSVNPNERTCRVKTIGQKGRTDTLDLLNVKWLSLSSSTGEDEDDDFTIIPRVGQYGVITFINSEPYIMGFYRPTTTYLDEKDRASAQTNINSDDLSAGDRVIKTIAGNRVILRSGGTVEIESNKLCRTYWIPSRRIMNSVCGTYELEVDGGFMHWTRDTETGKTTLRYFIYDAANPTAALDLQFGTTESANKFIVAKLGSLNPDTLAIEKTSFDLGVEKDGTTSLTIGEGSKTSLKISGTTGNIELKTEGEVDLKAKKVQLNGKVSGVTTGNSHQNVIDLITGVPVRASTTVFGDV